jgi:hypothetical protein
MAYGWELPSDHPDDAPPGSSCSGTTVEQEQRNLDLSCNF